MAVSGFSYDDAARKEDLLDVLTNLSHTDMQLVSGLAVSSAKDIYHQWLIDSLGAVKLNAYVEGADASYPALTNPTRLANWTQISRQGFEVTDTEREVNTAAFNDRYVLESTKALRMLKNDMEFAILRSTLVTGTGSAARQCRGIKWSLSLVTNPSGVSLSEVLLNDRLQDVWTNTSTQVNAIYADMYIKRKISGFSGNATAKNVSVEDRRLINAVDVYSADAASMVKLFAHRHATISGDVNHDVMGIDENLFKVAYLRKPATRELAKTGDSTKGEVVAEYTLENLHYNGGFLSQRML